MGWEFLFCLSFLKMAFGKGKDASLGCGVVSSTFLFLQPLGYCYKDFPPCAWSCSHSPAVDTITRLLPDSPYLQHNANLVQMVIVISHQVITVLF